MEPSAPKPPISPLTRAPEYTGDSAEQGSGASPRHDFSEAPTLLTDVTPPTCRVIRGYRLFEKLGSGAYGVVYRGESSGGVEVAVKEVRYALDRHESKRELDALELIKGLRHSFLIALHDFWIENDCLYMVLELADGNLGQLLGEDGSERPSQQELLRIFDEAAESLDFLHEHRVLHRDIKPANILLLGGHVKVADLGLAKFNPEDVATSQGPAGTPAYMAPETFGNEFRPGSDQYSLALCYAELRLGRRICPAMTWPAAIAWHLHDTPKLDGLEPHEEKAVRRAVSKNPSERFPSCLDFVRALRQPKPAAAPAPRRERSWGAVIVLLMVLPILIAIVSRPSATPTDQDKIVSDPTKPQVGWLPNKDFFSPGNVPPVGVYYPKIAKQIADDKVVFLLIPREKDGSGLATFYMMENKVSNRLFKAALADPKFRSDIAQMRKDYPAERMEWKEVKEEDNAKEDELPVFQVNVLEAHCFARWLCSKGGQLPTVEQWDKASGKDSGAAEIYRPGSELTRGDVAVKPHADGAMAVGSAKRDISPFHCRDRAGNGREWTRTLSGSRVLDPPKSPAPGEDLNLVWVCLRGQSFDADAPFRFIDAKPSLREDFVLAYSDIGFRVVIEP